MSIEALTIVNNHIIDEDTGERTALPEAKIQLTELPPVEDADSLLPRKIQCSQCQTDIICDPDKATDGYWADLYGTVPRQPRRTEPTPSVSGLTSVWRAYER